MNLFVSDLDGTLLNSEITLSAGTIEKLNRLIDAGLLFTVATARSLDSASQILAPLNLRLPLVLFNGVFIYDPLAGRYLESRFVDSDMASDLVEFYEAHGIDPFVYTVDEYGQSSVFYKELKNYSEERYVNDRLARGDRRFKQVGSFEDALMQDVITINAIEKDSVLGPMHAEIKQGFDLTHHYAEDIYAPGFYWLELTHRDATKRQGVEFLKRHVGASKLICFGDHLNDLPMFELADEAYAVENAHAEVKRAADGVIGGCDFDGVVEFLVGYDFCR